MKKWQQRTLNVVLFLMIPFGLLMFALPHIYAVPKYADLDVKEISVASIGYTNQFRGGKSYYLTTTEGEQMYLQGTFSLETIQENLRQSDVVTVRYHRGLYLFWEVEYVCEMKLGDLVLIEPRGDDYQREVEIVCLVMGSIVSMMGIVFFGSQIYLNRRKKK